MQFTGIAVPQALRAAFAAAALIAASAASAAPQVAAYIDTSCGVISGGAYCWGYNGGGQIGNGTQSPAFTATPVTGLSSGVSAIAVGGAHACAVMNGGAWCWGYNGNGRLGNNSSAPSLVPVAVAGLSSGVTSIATGDSHSCALVNGGVQCWGANFTYGQLGDGTTAEPNVPVAVSGLGAGVVSITASGNHSCAVLTTGAMYCWGANEHGQLGNNGTAIAVRQPVLVTGFAGGVGTVDAGGSFTCGVVNGGAQCWGFGVNGQLGNNGIVDSLVPVPVSGLGVGISYITAGSSYHGCAIAAGQAYCWGYNNAGQLGNAAYGGGSNVPIPVIGLPAGATQIAAGGLHTCAVAPGGIWCWGSNSSGQLGTGSGQPTVPTLAIATPISRARTDFNNDGRSDILYRNNATGQVYRILMNGLTPASEAMAFTEPNTAWKVIADADFNGDGVADLLWRNTTTGQFYFQPFAANGLPLAGNVFYTEPNPAWTIAHTPDLDGDGKADLLWYNTSTGQAYAMLMNGGSIKSQGTIYTEPNTAWRIAAVGDFAGVGKSNQLLWRNGTSGQLFIMTVAFTAGTFSQTGAMIYTEPNTAWKVIGAPDLNGDGKSDILWRNDATGQVYGMLMNGASISSQAFIYSEPNVAWKIVAQGDYNGDGKSDLLYRNDATGQVYMILMNGLAPGPKAMVYTEPNLQWKVLGPLEYGN